MLSIAMYPFSHLESSDEEELDTSHSATQAATSTSNDSTPAWRKAFNLYLNTTDEIPEGQTIVQWWGVSFNSTLLYHIFTHD
jgi:hypothetical protein